MSYVPSNLPVRYLHNSEGQYCHDDVIKGNIFHITGHLCGEFTGPRWIPRTKANDAELWCLLWSLIWINDWVNNREAGDFRRYRAHYDVIVMQRLHHICAASFNSLGPGSCGCNLELIIFNHISRIDISSISCEIVLGWMPKDFTDD